MAEGDIGAVIATIDFHGAGTSAPEILCISGNIFVVVYSGTDNDGWMKTFEITDTGTMLSAAIDTLEFDPVSCYTPDICHIFGDIFAIAYRGPNNDGYLKTVEITEAGAIPSTVEDTMVFEAGNIMECSIVHVSGSIYAIAYEGVGTQGKIVTVSIANDGTMGDTVEDSFVFYAASCADPKIIHIAGNIYAVVFRGVDDDGFIVTVEIAGSGVISDPVVDSFEFDTARCTQPVIIHIAGDIFAIAYGDDDGDGFIVTVEITEAGAIGDPVVDSFEFDTVDCSHPSILHISGDVYAIAYTGVNNDGYVKTISISTAGVIADPVIDTLEFETADCSEPYLAHVSGNVYVVAFITTNLFGSLSTFDIKTLLTRLSRHELLMGIG